MKAPPVSVFRPDHWPAPLDMPNVGPGIYGMVHDDGETFWVGWIHALPPGEGNGSRWVDSLPIDKRIVFIDVIGPILAFMLQRRGYVYRKCVFIHELEEIDGWVKEAEA